MAFLRSDNLRTKGDNKIIKQMQGTITKFHKKMDSALSNAALHSKKEAEAADKVKLRDKTITALNTEIADLKWTLTTAHKNIAELKEKVKAKSSGGGGEAC